MDRDASQAGARALFEMCGLIDCMWGDSGGDGSVRGRDVSMRGVMRCCVESAKELRGWEWVPRRNCICEGSGMVLSTKHVLNDM